MKLRRLISLLLTLCLLVSNVSAIELSQQPNEDIETNEQSEETSLVTAREFSIEKIALTWTLDTNEYYPEIDVLQVSDTVFVTDPNYVFGNTVFDNIFHTADFFIIGNVAHGKTITKIWSATEVNEHPQITLDDNGGFAIYGGQFAGNYSTDDNEWLFQSTGYFAGCYYFKLNDGTIYTLIVDSNYHNENEMNTGASFVGLYNVTEKEWLGDSYQIVPTTDRSTHLIKGEVSSDSPITLAVQVHNSGDDYLTDTDGLSTVRRYQLLDWQDMKVNSVVVNGELLSDFYSGNSNESAAIFSNAFALNEGWNTIEVRIGRSGVSLSKEDQEWFRTSNEDLTEGVVFLLKYTGPESDTPENNSTDTSLSYVKAVIHGADDTDYQFAPIEWSDAENAYVLSVPTSFIEESTDPNSYDHAVFLTAKPAASGATVKISGQQSGDEDIVIGTPAGCISAIGIDNLSSNDEFVIEVTAQDNTTTYKYPVKVQYESSAAAITELTLSGATLYPEFKVDTFDYYLDYPSDDKSSASLAVTPNEGATVYVNGKKVTGTVDLSSEEDFYKVAILAADGYTTTEYYLVTRYTDDDGNDVIPYSQTSDETRELAASMLKSWYTSADNLQNLSSYWLVFMAKAAGCDFVNGEIVDFSFDNKNVYDVSSHRMKQATDWAACIMQIVMLGENPYDFPRVMDDGTVNDHYNYVQGLVDCGGGPFANTVWYTLAAQAVGIESPFVEAGKENALSSTYDLDTRAWWIAALSGSLEPREMVRYVDSLHDAQNQSGQYTSMFYNKVYPLGYENQYTNGCVFSAIASNGTDIEEHFELNGQTPLQTENNQCLANGATLVKDMVIGLGDILNGSNVWSRYALTNEKYTSLIAKAQTLNISTESMPAFGATGYGKAYYDLYVAVADALEGTGDYSMRPDVTWGMPYQLFEDAVAALPETITVNDFTALKDAIDMYEAMDEGNRNAVSSEIMDQYHASVLAALKIKDSYNRAAEMYDRIINLPNPVMISENDRVDVEAARALYNTMTSSQRTAIAWAGQSVMDKLAAAEAALEDLSNRIEVTFTLLGDHIHAADETAIHTLKDDNLETWIAETTYTVSKDATAYDVFQGALTENDISWYNPSGTYVTSITKGDLILAEKSNGDMSGWMYTVNGVYPTIPINEKTLVDGDEIVVHYTDDYTVENTGYTEPDRPDQPDEPDTPDEPDVPDAPDTPNAIDIPSSIREMYDATAETLLDMTPGTGSIGGEWMIFGLARSTKTISDAYKNTYLDAVKDHISTHINGSGQLQKEIAENVLRPTPTENARIALALTALGENPANFDGRDLLVALENTGWVTDQGNNSTAFALLAFNAAGYSASNEDALINSLIGNQLESGAWSISGTSPDQDTTMMVVTALAPYYKTKSNVTTAVDKALNYIKDKQTTDGGFGTTAEGNAQVIVALTALGIDPDSTDWNTNNGLSVIDALAEYYTGTGFMHDDARPEFNQMASEQSFYAMVAYIRYLNSQPSLYDMSSADNWPAEPTYKITVNTAENGTVTTSVTSAEEGATVTVTAEPAENYTLDTLTWNGTNLTATKQSNGKYTATFTMPAKAVTVQATFKAADNAVADVADMMKALSITSTTIDQTEYEAMMAVQEAYNDLTTEQKAQLEDEYSSALAKYERELEDYEEGLENTLTKYQEKLEKAFDKFDEEDYSEENWEAIEDLYEDAKEALEEAIYKDAMEEVIADFKEDAGEIETGADMEVTFRLIGDFKHEDTEDHVEYVTWIATTDYTLESGATVYDLFMEAISDAGLNQKGASSNYVSSIQAPDCLGGYWLSEFDNGKNSGWMYTVNGDHPSYGLTDWELKDGDEVIWHYVDDYKTEEDKNTWLKAKDIDPEDYVDDALEQILVVGDNGEVEPDEVKASDIGKDITFKFIPDDGYVVKEVKIDGESKGKITSYKYEDLRIDSRIEVEFAEGTAAEFDDVKESDWFYEDVQFAVQNGLFNGTSDTTFSPNVAMNRAMLVTVLYRLEGEPDVSGSSDFDDVGRNQWYTDAVIWATENEIVNGYGNGKFGPTDNITREQMATILYRYAQYKDYSVKATNSLTGYSDYTQISAYALKSLKWANAEGLINGRTETTLAPQGTATRAEVAAILHRFVENVVNAD